MADPSLAFALSAAKDEIAPLFQSTQRFCFSLKREILRTTIQNYLPDIPLDDKGLISWSKDGMDVSDAFNNDLESDEVAEDGVDAENDLQAETTEFDDVIADALHVPPDLPDDD